MPEFSEYIQSPIDTAVVFLELETNFPYYKNLTLPLKQRFVQRLDFYLREKKFVGRQGLEMTPRVRILVSACAVQITFGLDSFGLENFEYIVVYPDIYESPMTHKMHKGETNLNGFICLSWKHVLEGIKNPDDNYNLGIHEWMHALRFNGINFKETDYFFDGYINKWVSRAMPEYNKLRAGKKSIFRRYGAANIHEFLSVCTEHFFESPDEFKKEAPAFFDEMCILLNQLPSKTDSVRIGVRYALLNKPVELSNNQAEMTLKASFWGTLSNFGVRIIWVAVFGIILLMMEHLVAYFMLGGIFLLALIKMNNMYFKLLFFENHVQIKKGFFEPLSSETEISYNSLMKAEIFNGSYDSYNAATVFQFYYFNGSRFVTETAYCSDPDYYTRNLVDLLKTKKVNILLS